MKEHGWGAFCILSQRECHTDRDGWDLEPPPQDTNWDVYGVYLLMNPTRPTPTTAGVGTDLTHRFISQLRTSDRHSGSRQVQLGCSRSRHRPTSNHSTQASFWILFTLLILLGRLRAVRHWPANGPYYCWIALYSFNFQIFGNHYLRLENNLWIFI
jgi:hypothetical protein